MGWKKGEGLGKNGEGIVEPIKVDSTTGKGLGAKSFMGDGKWL
jgi:hypothetical protein